MKNELKSKFPTWVNEQEYGKYHLCMSDDIDSLLSCIILNQLFGYEIKYFYDFHNVYVAPKERRKEIIGVDIAIEFNDMKIWDNHVVKIQDTDKVNPNSANLNAINQISRSNYINKYAGSTLLQVMSYYNVPLPRNREALMILLTIDVAYKGHYHDFFKYTHNEWFKQMELEPLLDVLNEEKSSNAFIEIMKKYRLNEKIRIKDNQLSTNIKLKELSQVLGLNVELPNCTFLHNYELNRGTYNMAEISIPVHKPEGLFSFALTSKNCCQYTN